ncbi:hypothetical protein C0971_16875 [Bacillus methanolicus]|uniref:hypothetical protein n=1 Tax=Bacillus methanolicus TaxID=1471 RepID=UPI00200C2C67|nr:hypothetical protein [Bacillus methanolicus]UQD53505.1 hypothetical protein C0971_16875 [Bacillus methanolicus]
MSTKTLTFQEKHEKEFAKLLEYLHNYPFNKYLNEELLIQNLNKYHRKLRSLFLFSRELKGKLNHFYFQECVSELLINITLLTQGLYKQVNFSSRSAIENFFKFIYSNNISKNETLVNLKVSKLFEDVLHHFEQSSAIRSELEKLNQQYSTLCEFVHTSSQNHTTMVHYLSNLPFFSEEHLEKNISMLINLVTSMIMTLLLLFNDCFKSLSTIKKQEILESFNYKIKNRFMSWN